MKIAPLVPCIDRNPTSRGGMARYDTEPCTPSRRHCKRTSRRWRATAVVTVLTIFVPRLPVTTAQNCIPLAGSSQCPAFNASSVSTDSTLSALYPFLAFVSNTQEFDSHLSQYVNQSYVQSKYQQLLGCSKVDLTNTSDFYARYTTSVICNAIVQNSISPCSLSPINSRPLCAQSCAEMATSEEEITTDPQLCGTPNSSFTDQIRADFTNCALPANSLSGSCITGEENEPDNCGYSTNLPGLCGFCAASSPNATDSCCLGSNASGRCTNVTLPVTSTMPSLSLSTSTTSATGSSTATETAAAATAVHNGLSKGQIAGIVVGSVIGGALVIGLLLLFCFFIVRKRRRGSQRGSVFNHPSPKRKGDSDMAFVPQQPQAGYDVLPGGRIARMSALEGSEPRDSPPQNDRMMRGAVGGRPSKYGNGSDSDAYSETPLSRGGEAPPTAGKRHGSLSSQSALGAFGDGTSPNSGSGDQYSSPEGVASGQSEQLPSFKDYYSQEEIHPNDKVATLWAYQPRAGDEFELERGDMLKVVGIWDDGWATGVRVSERAEDYDGKHKVLRDSGVSSGSSGELTGDLKAFPLVCVCLPQYWKDVVEGDGALEPGSGSPPQGPGPSP